MDDGDSQSELLLGEARPSALNAMTAELQGIQLEIRTLNRQSSATMGLVVAAAALVLSLPDGTIISAALRLLPVLVGIALMYNLNVAADVAVMAELRDCLASRLNRAFGTEVYLERRLSDVRRLSPATVGAYVLAAMVLLLALAAGLVTSVNGVNGDWGVALLVLEIGVVAVVVVALVTGVFEVQRARNSVRRQLEKEFPDDIYGKMSAKRGWLGKWWAGV